MDVPGQPVVSCEEAFRFEADYFAGDEKKAWAAMQAAGRGVGDAIAGDFAEIGGLPDRARVLVLAGKGHNGGDALIAAERLLELQPDAQIDVASIHRPGTFKPLTDRAWRSLTQRAPKQVRTVTAAFAAGHYDVAIDGVFGFQFRPPLVEPVRAWLRWANRCEVRLRAAVDLPSGWDDPDAFRADFTYATGLLKAPALRLPNAGRLRWLDLGFDAARVYSNHGDWILSPGVLEPLRALRPSGSDKRTFGHVFIVGGSRNYPGAVLMSVLAALRSGVGLVTAFVPESLVPAFAARAPAAMWVGWPETPEGGLALEGLHLFEVRQSRATAVLAGPGLGREVETLAAMRDLARRCERPLVFDADALQRDIVTAGSVPRILTPHAGEYARIADGREPADYAAASRATLVLKGPVTRITSGGRVYHHLGGGPVLARGGSGDLLAGLAAGLLAQTPADPHAAACCAVAWHGRAAERLARERGQVAVEATDLLEHLAPALRSR